MKIYYKWHTAGAHQASLRGGVCIVIDIFRASSTIVTALANEFTIVKPLLRLPANNPSYLIAAEKDGIKIKNSDFNNSPCEILSSSKRTPILGLKSTNGVPCIKQINNNTAFALVGCLLNATSVTNMGLALSKQYKKDVYIVMAGVQHKKTEDDKLVGEYFYYLLQQKIANKKSSLRTFKQIKQRLLESDTAQRLIENGCRDDVIFCSQLDIYKNVPIYLAKNNHIVNLKID